jgi:hypothetical protein
VSKQKKEGLNNVQPLFSGRGCFLVIGPKAIILIVEPVSRGDEFAAVALGRVLAHLKNARVCVISINDHQWNYHRGWPGSAPQMRFTKHLF